MMMAYDGGPRERLRTATGSAHARVDACFPHGLDGDAAYRRYLRGMHALVDAVETGIAAARLDARWEPWRHPQRVEWLRADLEALQAVPMPAGPGLALADAAQVAGALYVIEGSALGATQLLRDARGLGWTPAQGARFLDGHGGSGAGKRWRDYVHCLEGACFGAHDEQTMFDAAARTFAYAEHEFLRAAQHQD